MSIIKFTKMCATGNDFIVADNRDKIIEDAHAFSKQVCSRRFGIGADGVLLLENSEKADFKMRIINADGTEAEMCGNGARCIARFAQQLKPVSKRMRLEIIVGIIEAEAINHNIRLKMSNPCDMKLNIKIEVNGKEQTVHYIDTGVPHAILYFDNIESVDVMTIGSLIRYHKNFSPRGTNVDFVSINNDDSLNMRTYERGVEGETYACGTGAVASAAISYALGKAKEMPTSVNVKGGILKVDLHYKKGAFSDVFLEGDAQIIYEGELVYENS
ncbi:diaminopimelate epimerase [bacterium]|nr:diaminopimelate epimerase [bacterium]